MLDRPAEIVMQVREYQPADRAEWGRMRTALWSDQTSADMDAWLARPDTVVIVADAGDGRLRGFVEVVVRSVEDCCETSPVAYLEGWWVDVAVRRQGVGASLIAAAEAWALARAFGSSPPTPRWTTWLPRRHMCGWDSSRWSVRCSTVRCCAALIREASLTGGSFADPPSWHDAPAGRPPRQQPAS